MTHISESDTANIQNLKETIGKLETLLEQTSRENDALREKVCFLEKGFASVQTGVLVWNIVSRQLYVSVWSDQARNIAQSDAPLETFKQQVSPETFMMLQSQWMTLVSGKSDHEQITFDLKLEGQNIQTIQAQLWLTRDAQHHPVQVSGTFWKKERKAFSDICDDFSTYDPLPIGIVCLDARSGSLLKANSRAREILQIFNGSSFLDEDPFNKIDWNHITETLSRHGIIEGKELEIRLADGTKKWILFSGKPAENHVLWATILDFTDIKSTLSELQKINFELDNFVYHASHDLRAPLRTVLGLLAMLKQETNHVERSRCVDLIEGTINRLDTLVVDLLSISRNNRTQQRFVDLNFMTEVNTAISNFYHVGDTKNLEIYTKISQPVRYVSDLTRIRIILNNLISNAIKYRRQRLEASYIDVRIWVDAECAYIEVEDNGEGIDEDKLPYIFNMFYRASDKSEGSGLGLYIVKDVVEKLNGTIEVTSERNVGTTFKLTLPNHYKPADS